MRQAEFAALLQARAEAEAAVRAAQEAEALAYRALEQGWRLYLEVLKDEAEAAFALAFAHLPTVRPGERTWWVKEVDPKLATLARPAIRGPSWYTPQPVLTWQDLYLQPDWYKETREIRLTTGFLEGTHRKCIADAELEKLRALAPKHKGNPTLFPVKS